MTSTAHRSNIETSEKYLVAEIIVEGLYGKYSYRISPLDEQEARLGAPQLMLLYGDNGCGKTTILRMLWHLLSPAANRAHRTTLMKTPFLRLAVRLGNGDVIMAEKQGDLTGPMQITVTHGNKTKATSNYPHPRDEWAKFSGMSRLQLSAAERRILLNEEDYLFSAELNPSIDDAYVSYLESLSPSPFLLADDRRIHIDTEDADRERRVAQARHEPSRQSDEPSLALELSLAIRRTNDWLRREVLTGSAAGSQGADEIYREVLEQLAQVGAPDQAPPSTTDVREKLTELDAQTKRFSEFGLVPHVSAKPFISILRRMDRSRADLVTSILDPYLSGQQAKLESLQQTEEIVRTFTQHLNRYLVNKQVMFTPQRGLRVHTVDDEPLTPAQLSSGERQLLLLMCNSLLSRPNTSLFLIDEPELSLNAKWQRNLIRSLLDCVKGASVQFIMATHSIEIITRHRQYLAALTSDQG